ncbi:Mur ligase [Clohesyomyces aquaticus]|uniref:Mur ligase n=1 Tax=Clohesyomyces aquaticus TaxID=1231657 RepID=A0A1Y1ZGK6_9PLEO|nr:Mur ligase [Clohesyomyces aquaticus]
MSIKPGLERIGRLLKDVPLPWKSIHVAGTNGKGSICAHASALVKRRALKVGRFTSPHIVRRWDCITVNEKPVDEEHFKASESYFLELNEKEAIGASPFEILTATAFHVFTMAKVKVAVVECGLGGTLDATNILNNQAVSIISKVAYDHQDLLGKTLSQIASHKAGILRPNVPYLVDLTNEPNVLDVIRQRAQEIGAGPEIRLATEENRKELFQTKLWHKAMVGKQPFQRDNAVLAYFAVKELVGYSHQAMLKSVYSLKHSHLPGRLQYQTFSSIFGTSARRFLMDGAHNQSSAVELRRFVEGHLRYRPDRDKRELERRPVIWVVAMSEGKDVGTFLRTLVMRGDAIVATSFEPVDGMPWVKPMSPQKICDVARTLNANPFTICNDEPGALRALMTARALQRGKEEVVVAGSLYLMGQLRREKVEKWEGTGRTDEEIDRMIEEENIRVDDILSNRRSNIPMQPTNPGPAKFQVDPPSEPDLSEEEALQREIDELDAQLARISQEEDSLKEGPPQPNPNQHNPFADFEPSSSSTSSLKFPPPSPNVSDQIDSVRRGLDNLSAATPSFKIRTHMSLGDLKPKAPKPEPESQFKIRPITYGPPARMGPARTESVWRPRIPIPSRAGTMHNKPVVDSSGCEVTSGRGSGRD